MYESPIEIIQHKIRSDISNHVDDSIYTAVVRTDIHVNRDELIKALAYDRNQYEKGFEDGKSDALKWISVKDRAPERFISVLVHMPGEAPHSTVREGYMGVENWYAGGFHREDREITHWMPLPEPPKEDV